MKSSPFSRSTWDSAELAWVAGLFEGEGWIGFSKESHDGRQYVYPRLQLSSTDHDVIETLRSRVGCGTVNGPFINKPGYKPQWAWYVAGFENVQQVIALMWPWLCERRKERAVEVLAYRPVGRQ